MTTDPYPWPYDSPDGTVDGATLAVVVCGWQPHWVRMLDWHDEPIVALDGIRHLIDSLRSAGASVVWIRHGSAALPPHRPPSPLPAFDSEPWQLMPGPKHGDTIIDTPGFDAFLVEWTDLALRGRHLTRLVMCGLGTETMISSTTRSANDRGYECLTLTDASVHNDRETGRAQLSSITMSGGIFGAIGASADLIDSLSVPPIDPLTESAPIKEFS